MRVRGSAPFHPEGAQARAALTWSAVPPAVAALLAEHGFTADTADAQLAAIRRRNQERVREGDLEHLVHYVLQATSFTTLRPIEPAVSARMLVEGLADSKRAAFLKGEPVADDVIPTSARDRLQAFAAVATDAARVIVLDAARPLVHGLPTTAPELRRALSHEYLRVMRFLYEKEFIAARGPAAQADTSQLYQTRGLSTDASVEAGYAVYLAFGTLRALEPQRAIRRVLIVGPGLDTAPRTGFAQAVPPQSYQPFAVMDALLVLRLSTVDSLAIVGADINSRVVTWLNDVTGTRLRLRLQTSVAETGGVRFTDEFKRYFADLGAAIGESGPPESPVRDRLAKTLDVSSAATHGLSATALDIVVDRLPERFDAVVVTNVFPYLSDAELVLAVTNIASMLAPGGVLIHNEPRPLLARAAAALSLAPMHTRSTTIASVAGSTTPLYDAVWMYQAPR